jgi:hypothetical protein
MYHGNLKPLMGAHIPGLVAPQLHSLLSRCPPRGEGHSQTVGRSVFIPEDGLETGENVFREEDSETVWTMWNMSDMYRHRGNVEEACKLLERVWRYEGGFLGMGS